MDFSTFYFETQKKKNSMLHRCEGKESGPQKGEILVCDNDTKCFKALLKRGYGGVGHKKRRNLGHKEEIIYFGVQKSRKKPFFLCGQKLKYFNGILPSREKMCSCRSRSKGSFCALGEVRQG